MRILIGIVLLAALLLPGCSSKYRLHRDRLGSDSPWPYQRGGAESVGSLDRSDFDGQLSIVWQQSTGDKPSGPLSIHHEVLIFPGSRKKVRFYDIADGDYRGRLKYKSLAQSGMVVSDSIGVVALAPRKSRLEAVNLLNRKSIWHRQVKDVCPGSILVNSSLIVSSTEGLVSAYAVSDGQLLWSYSTDHRLIASASYADGKIFQPDDRGVIYVLAEDDGRELFRVQLDGPVAAPVAVTEAVYATDILGHVYAFDASSGDIHWKTQLAGPVWTSPAVRGNRLFVGHSGGQLVALATTTGEELWACEFSEVIKAAPIALGDFVIVGTGTGVIASVNGSDGSIVDQAKISGSVDYPPVSDGARIYVATDRGKITCFGE